MRTVHIYPFHKPDWHLVRREIHRIVHDPLFWVFLILGLLSVAMIFYVMLVPGHPEPVYSPFYPFLG
jgi:hypothetical protein